MKNQVLSIEQMQKLKDLGVDTSNASMYWRENSSLANFSERSDKNRWILTCHYPPVYYKPTFTLHDILEIDRKRFG